MAQATRRKGRLSWGGVLGWLGSGFDFASRQAPLPFALTALKMAGAFLVAWGIEQTGLLAPGLARQGELIRVLQIVLFFPILSLMTRRLNDTAMPTSLLYLTPLLFGLSSVALMMFDQQGAHDVLRWAGIAGAVAVLIGLGLPSRMEPAR